MRSDGVRALFVVVWMAVPGWADVRPADAIREEYAAVWQRLVAREFDVGAREKEARSSDDLRRAWELVGEHVASFLRSRPGATADHVREAVRSLNPEDPSAACKSGDAPSEYIDEFFCTIARFALDADALLLASPHRARDERVEARGAAGRRDARGALPGRSEGLVPRGLPGRPRPECVACRHQCRRRARLPPWCDARDGLTSPRSPR